jgi:hypothetical protein
MKFLPITLQIWLLFDLIAGVVIKHEKFLNREVGMVSQLKGENRNNKNIENKFYNFAEYENIGKCYIQFKEKIFNLKNFEFN